MDHETVDRLLARAMQAARSKQQREATRLYLAVLDRSHEHPGALNGLGMQALSAGEPGSAASYFRRAVARDAKAIELRMNLATALRGEGDVTGERGALEDALAIDQRHFMAIVRLAELFERAGDEAQALERWSNVVALAALLPQRPPSIEALLAHAERYVRDRQSAFARDVDAGLADARDGIAPQARRRVDACIDHALGRRRIYSNDCAGLHVPFLPAEEFFDRDHFPWLESLEAKTAAIRHEFEHAYAIDGGGVLPYVAMESGTPENKWSALDGSLDWSAVHLWKHGQRDDAVCARFPETAAIVESLPLADIPGRTPTVFFSILRPGTHLPAHTGVSNLRTIIHLPLKVPSECMFRVGGETRRWREGEAWAFDDTIEHEAWNRSTDIRVVLIFDVWNPHLSEQERVLLRQFCAIADAGIYNPRLQSGT